MTDRAPGPGPAVAIFDLDGTLTRFDTLGPYLVGLLARHPARWWRLLLLPGALLRYGITRDRGQLKSALIARLLGGMQRATIDGWSERYLDWLWKTGFHSQALTVLERHRAAGDHLVLLSASVTLYVPAIGRRLGFAEVICTGVRWQGETLDGALTTPNRRGEEKRRCLLELRERLRPAMVSAYGNAGSDLPHLALVEQPLLVNASGKARRTATAQGIAVADWR